MAVMLWHELYTYLSSAHRRGNALALPPASCRPAAGGRSPAAHRRRRRCRSRGAESRLACLAAPGALRPGGWRWFAPLTACVPPPRPPRSATASTGRGSPPRGCRCGGRALGAQPSPLNPALRHALHRIRPAPRCKRLQGNLPSPAQPPRPPRPASPPPVPQVPFFVKSAADFDSKYGAPGSHQRAALERQVGGPALASRCAAGLGRVLLAACDRRAARVRLRAPLPFPTPPLSSS